MFWTILATANLVCALLSYAFLAHALANLHWRHRGIFVVLLAIVICGQTWLVPQAVTHFWFRWNITLYSIWLIDWLVSAFSIVLFWTLFSHTSRDPADAARLDGCGALGIFWHIVLPLVRRTLLLIAILTLIATLVVLVAALGSPTSSSRIAGASGMDIGFLVVSSFLMTIPLIASFFYARRCSRGRGPRPL